VANSPKQASSYDRDFSVLPGGVPAAVNLLGLLLYETPEDLFSRMSDEVCVKARSVRGARSFYTLLKNAEARMPRNS